MQMQKKNVTQDSDESILKVNTVHSNLTLTESNRKLFKKPTLNISTFILDISELLPFLFIGADSISRDHITLQKLEISCIIDCTLNKINHFENDGIQYYNVMVNDYPSEPINKFFEGSVEFIEKAILNKKKVLIHCTMGISRSPTIALAYLLKAKKMSLIEAYKFMKEKRTMISPNCGFMKQLCDFEYLLYRKRTLNLDIYKNSRGWASIDELLLS